MTKKPILHQPPCIDLMHTIINRFASLGIELKGIVLTDEGKINFVSRVLNEIGELEIMPRNFDYEDPPQHTRFMGVRILSEDETSL